MRSAAIISLAVLVAASGCSAGAPRVGKLELLEIEDNDIEDSWYWLPDLSRNECHTARPVPWCAGEVVSTVQDVYKLFGATVKPLPAGVDLTVSAHVTCWMKLHGYSECSDDMCLVAAFWQQPANQFSLIVVYQDRPGGRMYPGGPSAAFSRV